jgi:hypothetical protein
VAQDYLETIIFLIAIITKISRVIYLG